MGTTNLNRLKVVLVEQNKTGKWLADRFQTKTQLMIAKINKTFDTAIRNRFFFLVCG